MNEITIGDKVYISAKRAAKITGYARDYVGQLCREGHVDAKMVGRSWYVYEPSIRAHRFGEEAVQEAPVADVAPAPEADTAPIAADEPVSDWEKPTYTSEKLEMLPELGSPRLEELLPPAEETLTDMQAAWREWFEQRQTVLETPEIESPEVIDERNSEHEEEKEAVEEEVSIPLHHIEEEEPAYMPGAAAEEEEIVPIHSIAPPPAIQAAPTRPQSLDIARTSSYASIETSPAVPTPVRYSADTAPLEHGRVVSERIVSKQSRSMAKKGKTAKIGARSYAPAIAALLGISVISIAIAAVGTGYAERYVQAPLAKNNPAINFLVGTREFTRQ